MTVQNANTERRWKLLRGYKSFAIPSEHQEQLLKLIVLIAVLMLLAFAIFNTIAGFQTLASIQLFVTLLFTPLIFSCYFHRIFSLRTLEITILCSAIIIFDSLLIFGGYANSGIYWLPIFPFLAFFTVGLYKGWYWLLAFLIIGLIIVSLSGMGWINIAYKLEVLKIFLATFLFYTLLAAIFAGVREKGHFELTQANKKLDQAQQHVELVNKNLEEQVQERTAELSAEIEEHKKTNLALTNKEKQFYQAQKMEAIGTLVGGIAHDFNNLLSGINANLFILQHHHNDEKDINKRTKSIEELVFHASEMIKQLLTFARRDHVELQNFNAIPFFSEAYKLAQLAIPETIKLQKHFITEPIYIDANASQLQQVMMNLINNARDALLNTTNPTIQVQLEHIKAEHIQADASLKSSHPEIEHKDYMCLSIIDNGPGIEKEKLKLIFEPFFTTKKVGKGTGLGLAMCLGSVQSHKGFIDVKSSLGKGTRFSIYIPLQKKENSTREQQKTISSQSGKGELILIVDDDESLREANAEVLEMLGYKTLLACNGLEAVQLFKKHQADIQLVFMDVMMPVMGGSEAAEHIRNIQADMPILFATGYDKDRTLDGYHPLPVGQHILSKPFTMGQLSKIIQQNLR